MQIGTIGRAWKGSPMTDDERRALADMELDNARLSRDFLLLAGAAALVATVGLLGGSAAVIIGAMLIAPLLNPMMASAWAIASGRNLVLARGMRTLVIGILVALPLSFLIGLLVNQVLVPLLPPLTDELLARTRPNIYDLLIALAGGITGAYALTRSSLSAALPGVAIATALMPPLCTIGLLLSRGELGLALGATLLFLTNFAAIVFSATAVFMLRGIRPAGEARLLRRRPVLLLGASVAIVTVLLTALTAQAVREGNTGRIVADTFMAGLEQPDGVRILTIDTAAIPGDVLEVTLTVRSPDLITPTTILAIQRDMAANLGRPVRLSVGVVPITILEPPRPSQPPPSP